MQPGRSSFLVETNLASVKNKPSRWEIRSRSRYIDKCDPSLAVQSPYPLLDNTL